MLRRSLIALLLGVIGAGEGFAGDTPARTQAAPGIIGWLKNRGDSKPAGMANGIERAVVRDAEKQSVVKKTSGGQQDRKATSENTVADAQFPQQPSAARPVSASRVAASAAAMPAPQVQPTPAPAQHPGYPQTGAALYPAPQPGIPYQVGGTTIVNPALQPHEMLYGHQYKALYGPYYYQVQGHWLVTPFGVWSQEDWRLKGTEVNVRYRTSVSPFSLFVPPALR